MNATASSKTTPSKTPFPENFLKKPHEAICPECGTKFEGYNARLVASRHYATEHRSQFDSKVRSPEIRDMVLKTLGKWELRMNQRAILERAVAHGGFFCLQAFEDSLSAHSLKRAGLIAKCSRDDAHYQERFWVVTALGQLVHKACKLREKSIMRRKQVYRKTKPANAKEE